MFTSIYLPNLRYSILAEIASYLFGIARQPRLISAYPRCSIIQRTTRRHHSTPEALFYRCESYISRCQCVARAVDSNERGETLAALRRASRRCAEDLALRPSLSLSRVCLRSKADNVPFLHNIWRFHSGEYSGYHLLSYDAVWSPVHCHHRSWTTFVVYWIRYWKYFQLIKVLSRVFRGVLLLTRFGLDDWIYCTYTLNSKLSLT
jgi:hypothetical protein